MEALQHISENILVLFPGALGDFVCFLPALEELGRDGNVNLLAQSEYKDLLPETVRVGSLERYEINRLFVPEAEMDERLRSFFSPYTSVYSWMGHGQKDFGRSLEILSNGRVSIFPFRSLGSGIHITDYYVSCTRGGRLVVDPPTIPLRSDALIWCERFWQQNRLEHKSVLLLAPGSGAKEKNWPVDFFRNVAGWWVRHHGGRVIVVFGPVEEERGEIDRNWGHSVVVCGLGLAKVAALLKRCEIYLGNDSGVSHLAAALGVKTVVLFGPSDPAQWAPRGRRVTIITKNVECSPCNHSTMKACPHHKCLTELSPETIVKVLAQVLERP